MPTRRVTIDEPIRRSTRRTGDRTPKPNIKHGWQGYMHHRCRCDVCTDACALNSRRRILRRRGELPPGERPPMTKQHGIASYNKGCRCERCKAAARDKQRRLRAARKAAR